MTTIKKQNLKESDALSKLKAQLKLEKEAKLQEIAAKEAILAQLRGDQASIASDSADVACQAKDLRIEGETLATELRVKEEAAAAVCYCLMIRLCTQF